MCDCGEDYEGEKCIDEKCKTDTCNGHGFNYFKFLGDCKTVDHKRKCTCLEGWGTAFCAQRVCANYTGCGHGI